MKKELLAETVKGAFSIYKMRKIIFRGPHDCLSSRFK